MSPWEYRQKPGIVGPDGGNTTFFIVDSVTDEDDWPNFFGTSAAAPHVAGVAALMREANGAATPVEIYAALEATATDMNEPGFDYDSGYGFVSAPDAVAAISGGGTNSPPTAGFDFACADLTCSFADRSIDDGTIVGWSWDFGDGGSSTVQNPVHTYAASGTYTVTLTVTDDGAATGSTAQSVTVSAGGTGIPDACDGLADGVHLVPASTNEGRTWTAIVDAVNCVGEDIANFDPVPSPLTMWWSPEVGTVSENCSTAATGVCTATQSGIPKKTRSVQFGLNGAVTTINRP